MALEATHMRFALDLKERYQVKDLEKYIVGAIYPDSRYISGIDRNLTHNEKFLNSEFAKDDFHKGWHCHLLVDDKQNFIIGKFFADLVPSFVNEGKFTYKEYPIFTAIKIIQDIDDIQKFDLSQCVEFIKNYTFNPNDEIFDYNKKYNQIIVDLYKDEKSIVIEDCIQTCRDLGISKKSRTEIRENIKVFLNNKETMQKVNKIYDETLKEINLYLNNN